MTAVTRVSAAQRLLSGDELLRLENCSREPIRTPGSIQSYGVLLVVDLATATITHASENAGPMLGAEAAELLARPLEVALGVPAAARIIEAAGEQQQRPGQPVDHVAVPVNDRFLDIVQHRAGARLLVELEPAEPVSHACLLDRMNRLTAELALARTVPELLSEAARALRDLTRFDRVLVYAFHPDAHGEVLAEEHADGMDDYLGLHFPASDIPTQARELYVANPLRALVDSGSDPVPVLTGPGWDVPALDLGPVNLRAVSNHHLTFMRNMGQAATVTLSLARRDTLIGMITCSHRVPHRLPYAVRRALRTLATQMSLQVTAVQETVRLKRQLESHSTRTTLAAQLRAAPHPVDGLTEGPLSLVDMLAADGAVAFFAGELRTIGAVPDPEQSHAVARHLGRRRPEEVFVSANLAVDDPELAALVPDVAGLVFVPLGSGEDYLLWYRREVAQTIRWLGDQTADNRADPLSPRNSFSSWQQSVVGCALAWEVDDLDQVLELRKDILDVMLRRVQARLAHHGLHDDLTDLPNRRHGVNRLAEALGPRAARVDLAVLFVDLDRFKLINDAHGHETGDEVIQAAAARLVSLIRPGDLVARLGGDEFMLALVDLDAAAAVQAGERIVRGFHEPLSVRGRLFHVAVSVGLTTTHSDSGTAPLDLLREADTAMYVAKRRGGAQLARYEPGLRPGLVRRLELEQALSSCWQGDELALHYQPVFAVPDGAVAGAEALLRWHRPGLVEVPPGEFVPILEESGLIIPVGRWVLRRATQQLSAWKQSGALPGAFTLAVNLSARQFADPGLIDEIGRLLSVSEVAPEEMIMEITETSAVSERREVVTAVRGIADLGMGLAIDDFGTGYSSMPMLTTLPVTQLKIDRRFVSEITSGHRGEALAAAVITLAHQFGLSCVAEGVEDRAQLERLRVLGCDYAQGFHLGRPLPAQEFTAAYLGPALTQEHDD